METRREFFRKVSALAAAGSVPAAVRKALAIEPVPGSTFLDAEHVVVLMQENRSFDHCFGTLQGVRGFNDPRAVTLPDGNPVWLQSNSAGETHVPFRLDLKGSSATWLGCLPHDWADQSQARNEGRHDRWLDTKRPPRQALAGLPLTLGFHNRSDLPFYYALADAFTVCDQAFCSSLTGTTPNRMHLWSGTIRREPHAASRANVRNQDAETYEGVDWTTFPERLEEHGISWRVYQNELSIATGLNGEETPWLGNFTDNPLEFFARYRVRFAPRHRAYLAKRAEEAEAALLKLRARPKPWAEELVREEEKLVRAGDYFRGEVQKWSAAAFEALPEVERKLHAKAFTTNETDPDFRRLEEVRYDDGGTVRTMKVPRGDVLHRFRRDAASGQLPAISWLVAPQLFSDHPDSPWYGAWYISEVLDILTANPDLWRKTIFILCYDENDGYFDHIPPFVPPDPEKPESGTASAGLDTELEFVRERQEEAHRAAFPQIPTHTGPIGLGYRVPLVVASPWSRGGYVNSQVFDHTSILRFLETFASHKAGHPVHEPNISAWRRAVCGDLTSVFRPAPLTPAPDTLTKLDRLASLASIHRAQFKPWPSIPRPLTPQEKAAARIKLTSLAAMPQQEPGTRPACALPYELSATGALTDERSAFGVHFSAGRERFGSRAAGAAFHVYAAVPCRAAGGAGETSGRTWAMAVKPGDTLEHRWPLEWFRGGAYHLRIHGPNGFYREFKGGPGDPDIRVGMEGAVLILTNRNLGGAVDLEVTDAAYGHAVQKVKLEMTTPQSLTVPVEKSHGWYDVVVRAAGFPGWEQRFAGRVETGAETRTDPLMGREV